MSLQSYTLTPKLLPYDTGKNKALMQNQIYEILNNGSFYSSVNHY